MNQVYVITNTITGDQYVGASMNVPHRMAVHQSRSKTNPGKLYQNMRKFGLDAFTVGIISTHRTRSAMLKKESKLIKECQPTLNTVGKKVK